MTKLQQDTGQEVRSEILGAPFAANEQVDREHMYRYLAANDLLPTDVTREIEDTFIEVARRELVGVSDLQNAGLVADLGSIGITQYEFERLNAMSAATQSMSIEDMDEDRVEFDLDAVPVPVTRKGFRLSQRVTALGSTRGASVAQVHVSESTRQVTEKLEDSLTNGGDAVIGGNSMPGYTNFSARQTVGFNDVEWSSTTDLQNALDDTLDMKDALVANGFDGPYVLYVPSNWDTTVEDDYNPQAGNQTLRDRIMSITGIDEVKVLPSLADSNAVLVQMTPDVVQIAQGQDITTVTWDIHGGLAQRWLVLGVMSFALKRADDGTGTLVSGIAHLS